MLASLKETLEGFSDLNGKTLWLEEKKGRKYFSVYQYDRDNHKRVKRRASNELVTRLQDRAYFEEYANQLEAFCSKTSDFISNAELPSPANVCASLKPAYRTDNRRIEDLKTDEERAWLIKMEAFKRKHPSKYEKPTGKASDSINTRSKAEAFCVGLLDKYKITYIYECPIFINGKYRYPDFILFINGKVFIWEHLGKIYDNDYFMKQFPKITEYASAGYILGSNLFLSFDGPDNTFDVVALENLLLSIINIAYAS